MPKPLMDEDLLALAHKQIDGETLEALLRKGLPLKDAAAKYHMGILTVARIRDHLGIPSNPSGRHGRKRVGELAEALGAEPPLQVSRRELGGAVAKPRTAAVPPGPPRPAQPTQISPTTTSSPGPLPKAEDLPPYYRFRIDPCQMPAQELRNFLQAIEASLTTTKGQVRV